MGVEIGKLKRVWESDGAESLACDEPPLHRQKLFSARGPLVSFPYGSKKAEFPEWFRTEDGRCFFGTATWASGAKGVVRKYEAPDGTFAMAKAYTTTDEYELEAAVSRSARGVPGLMRSWTMEGEPFVFGEWVDATLHDMERAEFDRLEALRAILAHVRRLNADLAANVGAYMDVTAANVGYRAAAKAWTMLDLGGVYLRGWGSQVVTPSYVPPFMWKRNLESTRDRFEIDATKFTLEELQLVGAYAVVATFATIAIGASSGRAVAFTLHSTYMRKHLSCNRGDCAKVFKRFTDAVSAIECTGVTRCVRRVLEVFLSETAEIADMRAVCEEIISGDEAAEPSATSDGRNN